ncbi:MAG: S9 family peptidase [Anaerolineales bacterium]
MIKKSRKPYGAWSSPISPQDISQGLVFSDVAWNDDGTLVWRERFAGQGRLIVQPRGEEAFRILNSDLAVRAGVGYGGGDFTVGHDHAYFVEADSKRIYRQPLRTGLPQPITPAYGAAASPQVSPDGAYLLYVHSYEDEDSLALVDTKGQGWPMKIVSGDDFYMHPRWHPEGDMIAWICWDHPNMPWDGTKLKLGQLEWNDQSHPSLISEKTIAGDEETSIFQAEFSPDGRYLAYASDQSGWWQLYLYDIHEGNHRRLTSEPAEHGKPAWQQEMRTFGFSADGEHIYFIRNQQGVGTLWGLELSSGDLTLLQAEEEYTWFEQIAISPLDNTIAVIASSGQIPKRILTLQPGNSEKILHRSLTEDIPPSTYIKPQHMQWQGVDGGDVFGLYYHPEDPEGDLEDLPPLIVLIHGGPTSQRVADFQINVQFFTSRGYAVLQPNYRGSTGYGRTYRNALRGEWGIYDVEDAISGAQHLASMGKVDEDKLVIMGGSAGGFTTLKALVDHPGVFKASVCLYGVANQFTLVADTHKFEQHYSDSLLGPLPQAKDTYRERSPLFFADKIQDALIIFQGGKDKVVVPDQAESIVEALKENEIPHEYHLYPEEGHGFKQPETLKHFYTTVEAFLKQHVIYA